MVDFARSDLRILRMVQFWSNLPRSRTQATVMRANGPTGGYPIAHLAVCVSGLAGAVNTFGNRAFQTDVVDVMPVATSAKNDYFNGGTCVIPEYHRFDGTMMRCDLPLEGFEVYLRDSDGELLVPGKDQFRTEWSIVVDLVLQARSA